MAPHDVLTRVTSFTGVSSAVREGSGQKDVMREFAVAPHFRAASEVRAAVTDWIPDHPRLDDVKHALSELVNNAVVHARLPGESRVRVTMFEKGAQLRFEVSYPNTSGTRRPRRVRSSQGYGLGIVEELVDNWGVESGPDRVVDWFEIGQRTYQDH